MSSLEEKICTIGRKVIDIELQAVNNLQKRIDQKFAQACEILLNCKGRIIVIGIGKSGHIANKIAATLSSTGSPAFFMHPSEAIHGDLGMLKRDDVILAISYSGTTPEVLAILPTIKYLELPIISFTGNSVSNLAKTANINLDINVDQEACSLGLAPTSSTTVALVLGDALAVALSEARGFTRDDFALSHPGGTLGKKLLLKAQDLMHKNENIPKINPATSIKDALLEITSKRLGMTAIVDHANKLIGVFTDGDLRRALDQGFDIHSTQVQTVMTKNCKYIHYEMHAIEALELMEQYNITCLPVINLNSELLGVIHIHDILKSGIIPVSE